jgi:hypothetical protein
MAMKVWDSCDETKKGTFTLHHIGLAAYPKRIMKTKENCFEKQYRKHSKIISRFD